MFIYSKLGSYVIGGGYVISLRTVRLLVDRGYVIG